MDLSLSKRALLKLLDDVDSKKKILEVGPLNAPLLKKSDADIYYADIYSTSEIKKRFSVDNAVAIDFVIKNGYEKTFSDFNLKFDYILLNNVLEHIPNPINTLLDMSKILNKNGKIGLLLPDREFFIDFYRENTSFVDWFDVYMRGEKNSSPRLALDFKLNHINERNPRKFWKTDVVDYPNPDIGKCLELYSDLIVDYDNNYFDEHYWAFTDRSFLRIIENLLKINIFPFKISNFYPTAFNDNVFGVLFEVDYDILNNDNHRLNQISEIRKIIKKIEKSHFEIEASDLIRENNKLKEILKDVFDTSLINSSAIEFFGSLSKFKKTIKGINGYLFLINDGNSELRQHFDSNYSSLNFNPNKFIKYFKIKKQLFNSNNIDSYFFIVPDKSVICKDFLPFNSTKFFRRNYDYFKGLFPDFSDELDHYDYFKYDTHMKSSGGRKLAYRFLKYIDSSLTVEEYDEMISKYNYVDKPLYDLVSDMNWSYSTDELRKYDSSKYSSISHSSLSDESSNIPKKFKSSNGTRLSYHYKNLNSLSDVKVLIFHDSSIHSIKNFLIPYFKESFFYWDHLNLNKDLIKWYNPDMIIEIRIERFLENYSYPDWIVNKEKIF